jgi:hypothetical protein
MRELRASEEAWNLEQQIGGADRQKFGRNQKTSTVIGAWRFESLWRASA